jgi:hypothetical protein
MQDMLMKIVACLLSPRRFRPIQIHLLLQKATQLRTTTSALDLRPADSRASIRRLDRGQRWCISCRWLVTVLVRRKVLRLDLLAPSRDGSLILCVHGIVRRVVAAIDRVVERAAECFGGALYVVSICISSSTK